MSATLRKGWCPGALRPMMARDGLIVRLRLTNGILLVASARALADLAEQFGNGLFDLTARGNLQMRGASAPAQRGRGTMRSMVEGAAPASIDPRTLATGSGSDIESSAGRPLDRLRRSPSPAALRSVGEDASLLDGLAALGLLDADPASESVRNVIASPLAGLHDGLDVRPLVRALEQALTSQSDLHALPGKFGFLVDDGSLPSLADVPADVRFDWDGSAFAIGLDGTADGAISIGACKPEDLVARATGIAKAAIEMFASSEGARRMRDLVAVYGAAALAHACGGTIQPAHVATRPPREIVGAQTFAGLPVFGLAAPFGRLDAGMLRAAADLAVGELRLTPWRTLLLPGVRRVAAGRASGFIVDPADPRLAVAACVGAAGCERGSTETHADAAALAALAPAALPGRPTLHVSGCEKGCAKPSASPVTLVARAGRYDLVRDGRPGDTPHRRGLDLAQARAALADMSAPA